MGAPLRRRRRPDPLPRRRRPRSPPHRRRRPPDAPDSRAAYALGPHAPGATTCARAARPPARRAAHAGRLPVAHRPAALRRSGSSWRAHAAGRLREARRARRRGERPVAADGLPVRHQRAGARHPGDDARAGPRRRLRRGRAGAALSPGGCAAPPARAPAARVLVLARRARRRAQPARRGRARSCRARTTTVPSPARTPAAAASSRTSTRCWPSIRPPGTTGCWSSTTTWRLPRGFLDAFVFLAERFGLRLAQPAHRARSHAAWTVTRRRPGQRRPRDGVRRDRPGVRVHAPTFETLLPVPAAARRLGT